MPKLHKFKPIRLPTITKLRLKDLPGGQQYASEIETGKDQWYGMSLGYKDAADLLASRIAREPWRHARLAAPMLFLYRHHLELHLKSLLANAGQLLDAPQAIPQQHYLRQLWSDVRALLLRISPQSDGEWFTRADQVIADFDRLDQGSFSCRYPVDLKGRRSLPNGFCVDARVPRRMIAELHILLDGASTQIDEYMGYKYETP